MKVIIVAAGDGSRWSNYLTRRKHLIQFDGETLLDRTVRLMRARGETDITIVHHPKFPYDVPGTALFAAPTKNVSNTVARLATRPLWSLSDRTLVILGDAYLSEATADLLVRPYHGWVQFARLRPSTATGKPGPEMVACSFNPQDHDRYARGLEEAGEGTDWPAYCAMTGHPINTPSSEIRDWGMHVEIPDDGTDDFDFGDDYERWMRLFAHRSSRVVTASDYTEPWFVARAKEFDTATIHLHRKIWEFSSIAQAYRDRLFHGGKILGFGVGKEPLPAWFAAHGADVLATDRPDAGVWLPRQHAANFMELRRVSICREETFQSRVSYEPADMRNLPENLTRGEFDMTYSASCFEHLGGVKAGLDFFCKQMNCLKQGGIAVHTTEYNVNSNNATLDHPELCAFRQKDLAELGDRLQKQGDCLWPITLTSGTTDADNYIDSAPYHLEPHLKIELGGHVITSVLLIAMRGRFK